MRILWHGTASIEMACSHGRLLFDPFVPLRGAEHGTALESYDGFEAIFVTHGHFDHISSIPDIIKRNGGTRVFCTQPPWQTLLKKGVPKASLALIRPGQTIRLRDFLIHALPGRHALLPRASFARIAAMLRSPWRGNLPHVIREHCACPENGETVFYHVEADGKSIALMGSLNLMDDAAYPQHADILVLPYNGWADNFLPAERVTERLKPRRILLDHFDDAFPPVTMPVDPSPFLRRHAGMAALLERDRPVQA